MGGGPCKAYHLLRYSLTGVKAHLGVAIRQPHPVAERKPGLGNPGLKAACYTTRHIADELNRQGFHHPTRDSIAVSVCGRSTPGGIGSVEESNTENQNMAQKNRTQPSPDQLRRMMRLHLSFEIGRFRKAASLWGEHKYGDTQDEMIRESCLIHMRLLLDFFYPRTNPNKSRFEDLFVSDYLPPEAKLREPLMGLLKEPPWLAEYRNQLDWRLAHFTLKRLDFEQRPVWKPLEQFAHLERLITEFLRALPPDLGAAFDPHRE
jgi:hypothetical protein